jgi:hypothetical protein
MASFDSYKSLLSAWYLHSYASVKLKVNGLLMPSTDGRRDVWVPQKYSEISKYVENMNLKRAALF